VSREEAERLLGAHGARDVDEKRLLHTIIALYDRLATLEATSRAAIAAKERAEARCREYEALFDEANPDAVNALLVNILRNLSPGRVESLARGLSGRYCEQGERITNLEQANAILEAALEAVPGPSRVHKEPGLIDGKESWMLRCGSCGEYWWDVCLPKHEHHKPDCRYIAAQAALAEARAKGEVGS
jgi:hypothetical protein